MVLPYLRPSIAVSHRLRRAGPQSHPPVHNATGQSSAGQGGPLACALSIRAASSAARGPPARRCTASTGKILLGCGAPSALAARHLLQAAHPGDPTSLAGLDRASARTVHQSPQTAADLAVGAGTHASRRSERCPAWSLRPKPSPRRVGWSRPPGSCTTPWADRCRRSRRPGCGASCPRSCAPAARRRTPLPRPASSSPSRTFPANWSARRSSRGFRRWPGDRPTRGPTGWRTPPWPPPASPATR